MQQFLCLGRLPLQSPDLRRAAMLIASSQRRCFRPRQRLLVGRSARCSRATQGQISTEPVVGNSRSAEPDMQGCKTWPGPDGVRLDNLRRSTVPAEHGGQKSHVMAPYRITGCHNNVAVGATSASSVRALRSRQVTLLQPPLLLLSPSYIVVGPLLWRCARGGPRVLQPGVAQA